MTGFKFAFNIANAVAQYVIAGIITSEFLGKYKDFKASVIASVPFAQLIAYFEPQNLEKFFSNSLTADPNIKSPFVISFLISLMMFLWTFLS